MRRIRNILAPVLLAVSAVADAQHCAPAQTEHRPVTSVYSIEAGAARSLSTYLSPLYYTGTDYALSGSWTKSFNHWPDRCVMRFEAAVDFQNMLNPAKTAAMYGLTARFN